MLAANGAATAVGAWEAEGVMGALAEEGGGFRGVWCKSVGGKRVGWSGGGVRRALVVEVRLVFCCEGVFTSV